MVAPHPNAEARKSSQLYEELKRLAAAMAPDWKGAGVDGEFGNALLRIASRMGAHVTQRIAKTPRKDSVEFYNMLDIPADAPVPAEVPLVFLLNDKSDDPVFAAAGVQVSASTDDGEVVFETNRDARITPARMMFIGSADGDNDRIDRAPDSTFALEESETSAAVFDIVSFASIGNRTLQLEPVEGVQKGDYLKIGEKIYQVDQEEDPTDGLVDLTEDLVANVGPDQVINQASKVEYLKAFELPDLQQHCFYIGHNELFNLVNPSKITVAIQPGSVRDNLPAEIKWQLWGTKDGDEEADWHEVNVTPGNPGEIVLTKQWIGTVDPRDIASQSSRWLRAHHDAKISAKKVPGTRVVSVQISVATLDKSEIPSVDAGTSDKHCVDFNSPPPKKPDRDDDSGEPPEKGLSITQAFHNGTPLPLTTRFFPFGPEPQRFDTFAIAAPEALSKKNANVTVDVTLPDASIGNITVARIEDGPDRGYAIAQNGSLQQLMFEGDAVFWRNIGSPQPEDLDEQSQPGQLELDSRTTLQAVQLRNTTVDPGNFVFDLVVARDKTDRIWAIVTSTGKSGALELTFGAWKPLLEAEVMLDGQDLCLMRREENPPFKEGKAALFAAAGEKLYRTIVTAKLTTLQVATRNWFGVEPQTNVKPILGEASRTVPVLEDSWPESILLANQEMLVLDQNKVAFRGKIKSDSSIINWTLLEDLSGDDVIHTVRPSAARLRNNELIAFFATEGVGGVRKPLALKGPIAGLTKNLPGAGDFSISDNTSFQCFPSGFGTDPLTIAVGTQESATSNGPQPSIAIWPGTDTAIIISDLPDSPEDLSQRIAIIFELNDIPAVLVNGGQETVHVQQLAEFVDFELHTAVVVSSIATGGGEQYFVEEQTDPVTVTKPVVLLPAEPRYSTAAGEVFALPTTTLGGATISSSTDWTVWKVDSSKTGSRHGTHKNLLKFEGAVAPGIDDKIITGDVLYTVVAGTDPPGAIAGHVQVNGNLPAGDPQNGAFTYDLVSEFTAGPGFSAKTDSVGTIVRLFDLVDPDTEPEALAFRSSGVSPDPARQGLNKVVRVGDDYWAVLDNEWLVIPDNLTEAAIVSIDSNGWITHAYQRGYQNPELAWEYFDGESWRRLRIISDSTLEFAKSGEIKFQVPENLAQGEVAGQEDYWVRARLVGGDYGSVQYIVTQEPAVGSPKTQKIEIDRSELQPPEILCIEVSFTFDEKIDPEFVYTHNNLTYRNQTQASASPEAGFEIFEGVAAINGDQTQRVIYFGLSKPFNGGALSIFVDADDQERETRLVFEVRGEREWRTVSAADETAGFHRRGYVDVSVDTVPRKTRLFDSELYWLRARPVTTDSEWSPLIRGFHVNAVRSVQAKSMKQEIVGSSTGEPQQRFLLAENPVIPESLELRIREVLTEEERAALNSETEGLDQDQQIVTQYEEELSIDGDWVRWTRVDSFLTADVDSRVFRLDAEKGEIEFGKDTRIPPAGANGIRAIAYQSGGGEQGNLDSYKIESPKSSIRSIETVANPIPSSGGTDTPSLDDQLVLAPHRLRHANLALTRPDIEALATASSPDVIRARCVSPEEPGDPIRVAVAVRTGERCPQPSIAYRDGIARNIRRTAWGALLDRDLRVEVPQYVKVRLKATVRAASVDLAARVEERATTALKLLLHPVAEGSGPRGFGWPFGRTLSTSDILRTLSVIEGFDHVEKLVMKLKEGGELSGDLPPTAMICAEEDDVVVKVTLPEGED